jgi:hypothetical protein
LRSTLFAISLASEIQASILPV